MIAKKTHESNKKVHVMILFYWKASIQCVDSYIKVLENDVTHWIRWPPINSGGSSNQDRLCIQS